jgi:hypothetical protein
MKITDGAKSIFGSVSRRHLVEVRRHAAGLVAGQPVGRGCLLRS